VEVMNMALKKGRNESTILVYVASNGDDTWSGRMPEPNVDGTDGPFATLHHAVEAIRQIKQLQGGELKQPVTIFVRSGTYFLKSPLVLTPDDSGSADYPVTFTAYRRERPIISGGRRITGWKHETIEGKRLWAVEIPEVKEGKCFFRQLWVNGQRRIRARHPNKGYLRVAEVPDTTTRWNEGQTCFRFYEDDLKAWSTVTDGEVVVMNRWVESRLPIASVDESERLIAFSKRSVFQLDPGDLYYVEHVFELLDAPGEWFLDRGKGVLYYYPLPSEDMQTVETIAPVLAQLIRLEGQPQTSRFVEHLIFRGLGFANTEWYYPEGFHAEWPKSDVGGFPQAAFGVPGMVYGEGIRHCVFDDCIFTHLGNYAVELTRGCQHNRISGCAVFDLGAGGVKIGEPSIRGDNVEQSHSNKVVDCHIHDGGLIFHSSVAVWIGQSFNNCVAYNHIHDFYYTGISVGWTWGYGQSLAASNIVEFNHVHHIGVRADGDGPILSDMGGVYTLGIQPGTCIRFNLFHDIAGLRYGGWGIYFDEGSTYIKAENNIVIRTTHGGFHQHYGRENTLRNNIFALGRDTQIQRTRLEQHISFTFERNIVYWREGSLLTGNFSDFNFIFDYNLYWRIGGLEVRFTSLSWQEWRAQGMDRNSLNADPLFIAPESNDFRLKPSSPTFKLGFQPIDLHRVGPRKVDKSFKEARPQFARVKA